MITQRLCQSCKDGDIKSVTSFLTRGANLNFCYGEMNRTPLHFSAESGNIEIVELLLHHGSSIDAVDKFGFTPLSLAVIQEGYIQCYPKQSAHGTLQVKNSDAFHSIIKLLVQLGADVATRDHTGNSIFHISAALGTIESLFYSLEDISTMTNEKYKISSNHASFVPRSKCCRLLRSPGWGYLTPLHYACCSAKFGSVQFLLESQAGCDPNAIDAYGWTPLHWAARSGNKDIVALLLKHGASLDIEDNRGLKPFQIAFIFYHTSLVRILLPNSVMVDEEPSCTPKSSTIVTIQSELCDVSLLKDIPLSLNNSTLEDESNPCFDDKKMAVLKKNKVFPKMDFVKEKKTETPLLKSLQNKQSFKNLLSLQLFFKVFYSIIVCICLGDMLGKLFLLPFYFINAKSASTANVFCDGIFVQLFNNIVWPAIVSLFLFVPMYTFYLGQIFLVTQRSASECSQNKTKNHFSHNIPTHEMPIETFNPTNSLKNKPIRESGKKGGNGFSLFRPNTRICTLVFLILTVALSIPALFLLDYFFSICFLLFYMLGGHGMILKETRWHRKIMTFCKPRNFKKSHKSKQCQDECQMTIISDMESGTIHGVESLCDPCPQTLTVKPTKWKYEGTSGGMIADMQGHFDVTYGVLPPTTRERDPLNSSSACGHALRFPNKNLKTVSTDQVINHLCNVAGYDSTDLKNGTRHSPLSQNCNFSIVSHSLSTKTKKTNKSTKSKYPLQDCPNSVVFSQKNKISFAFPGVLLPNVKASPASVIKGAFDGKYPGTHSWFVTMIKRLQKIQKKELTCCNTALLSAPTLLHSDFHLPGTGNYFELTYLEENIFIWFIHRLQYRLFQCMCDHWGMTLKPSSTIAPCDIQNLEKDVSVQLCQSACHMARLSHIQKKSILAFKDFKAITSLFPHTACRKNDETCSFSQEDLSSQGNTGHDNDGSTDLSLSCVNESFTRSSFSSTLSEVSSERYPVNVFEKPRLKSKEEGRQENNPTSLSPEKWSWWHTLISHLLFQASKHCSYSSQIKKVPLEYVDSCCTASIKNHGTLCEHKECGFGAEALKTCTNSSISLKLSKYEKESQDKKKASRVFYNKKHVQGTRQSTDMEENVRHNDVSEKSVLNEGSFQKSGILEDDSFCEPRNLERNGFQWNGKKKVEFYLNKVPGRNMNHVHNNSMLSYPSSRFCKTSIVSATLESSSVSAECVSNAEENESLVESCEDVFYIIPYTSMESDDESHEDGQDDIEIEETFQNNCLKGCRIKTAWDICFALLLQADQYHSFKEPQNYHLCNASPTQSTFQTLLDSYVKDEMETFSSQSYIITKKPCHWMLSDFYIHLISLAKTSSTDIQSGALLWQREFHKLAAYLDTTSPQLTSRWPVFYCSTTQIDRDRPMLQENQWLPGYRNPLAPLKTPACCQRKTIDAFLQQQEKMLLELADNHFKESGQNSSCTSHMKHSVSTTRDSNKPLELSTKTSKAWSVASHMTPIDLHSIHLQDELGPCTKPMKPTWFVQICCLQCVIKILVAVIPTHWFYSYFMKQPCLSLPRAPHAGASFFSLVVITTNAYFSLPMLITFLFSYSALILFHLFC